MNIFCLSTIECLKNKHNVTQIKNLYLKEKREKSKSVHEALNVRYSIYENKDNE